MTEPEKKPLDDETIKGLLGVGGKGIELFGRAAEGIFSSPWTGVPAVLLILSQVDPSGKMTIQFLNNLETFLASLARAAATAFAALGHAISNTTVPPPITITAGEGKFCFGVSAKLGLPFVPKVQLPTQVCFVSAADRDVGMRDFLAKAGVLAFLYDVFPVDK